MRRLLLIFALLSASPLFAQNGALVPDLQLQFMSGNGLSPNALGFVCTTAAGGTTSQLTYQDAALTVPNTNPILLNSAGRPASGGNEVSIYLQALQYRFSIYAKGTGNTCNGTTVGALIRQVDPVYDLAQIQASGTGPTVQCSSGTDAGSKIVAARAVLPSTGGVIDCRTLSGTQTIAQDIFSGETRPITLLLGGATFNSSVTWSVPGSLRLLGICGGTVINFTGTGWQLDTGASNVPNDVEIGCLAFTSTTTTSGFLRVGSTSTDFNNSLIRLRWNLHDLYLQGPGSAGSGQVGFSITQYLDFHFDNITLLNFERPAIFDRGGNSHFHRVRFQAFQFGPWWAIRAGTGTGANGSNQDLCDSCEFLGPTWGTGDTVTVQHQNITFINALYECQAGGQSTGLLHLTSSSVGAADSAYFTDVGGLFSNTGACGGGGALKTINFGSGYASPRFIGTVVTVPGFPPIAFGTPYSAGNADDYTAKFINCTYQLNALVRAQDKTGSLATIIGGPSVVGPGFAMNQSQEFDQSGVFRILGQTGVSGASPATGVGLEIQYQDPAAGDQSIINSIARPSNIAKPLLIQASGTTITGGTTTVDALNTATNCLSNASPAVCGSAASGDVAISNPATTLQVNTTRVTANSNIFVFEDSSLGAHLSVTCNTTPGRTYTVSARSAGVSFTITASATPAVNSACLSYVVIN